MAKRKRKKRSSESDHEPTMAQLEALIAKRLPTMPTSKNDEDHARHKRTPAGIRVYEDPARIMDQLKRNR